MEPVISVDGLRKTYGDTTALAGIDLTVRRGSVLGLLGPNGSGKTTTVRILSTLLRPDGGRATVLGHDVVADAAAVRGLVGLTGQYAAVDDSLTGIQNLTLIARLLDLSRTEARSRAAELVERFGLADAAERRVKTYSGGMRRRLDLAASLVGRPSVLFLDEPTTGLDPRHRNEVWDQVRTLAAEGTTVLLTTQYLEEADQLAEDLVVLDHGRVIASGTPASLKSEVGGQLLHVRPLNRSDVGTVAGILGELTAEAPAIDPTGQLSVAGDAALLQAVGARLAEVPLAELGLRLPSLDDVFLTLTGRPAEEEEVAA
ncbi:ATP-binding cassette domain-containing protein [Pseudonocardia pini]|uniref:ATP-binding cassette domain-containing protein n=1 Tax=Pseudonocardia pini TaxID=2758030 RepID=UPI0015F113BC|nr:ATP-binding cassette domain-containing protein [Pseudonocardia pini]